MTSQLHLNAFLMSTGHHEASWRHPGKRPDGTSRPAHFRPGPDRRARQAGLDVLRRRPGLLGRRPVRRRGTLEPTVLLSAMAAVTERIGLIATASTTYNEPSTSPGGSPRSTTSAAAGRDGTSSPPPADAARNFGLEHGPTHAERYGRAKEFLEVVRQALGQLGGRRRRRRQGSRLFADTDQMHALDHVGQDTPGGGPAQHRPSAAGPSGARTGRLLGGRHGASPPATPKRSSPPSRRSARPGVLRRYEGARHEVGRDPEQIMILPGICRSSAAPRPRRRRRRRSSTRSSSRVRAAAARAWSARPRRARTGRPVPRSCPSRRRSRASRAAPRWSSRSPGASNLTVRQLIERLGGGRGHRVFAGTPEQVADQIEPWFHAGAADGFNIMPPILPGGLEDFVEHVVPNCSAADCSAPSTPARPCASTTASRGRPTHRPARQGERRMTATTTRDVRKLSGRLGAEIVGVDLQPRSTPTPSRSSTRRCSSTRCWCSADQHLDDDAHQASPRTSAR